MEIRSIYAECSRRWSLTNSSVESIRVFAAFVSLEDDQTSWYGNWPGFFCRLHGDWPLALPFVSMIWMEIKMASQDELPDIETSSNDRRAGKQHVAPMDFLLLFSYFFSLSRLKTNLHWHLVSKNSVVVILLYIFSPFTNLFSRGLKVHMLRISLAACPWRRSLWTRYFLHGGLPIIRGTRVCPIPVL